MAHFRSDYQDFRQQIDTKVDHMLEMLASMQQHLEMQEMTKGKEFGVGLCGAEIQSQHQIVTSATSCEEAESGAKSHLENLELVFEKPYAHAKLQSYSEKLVLMCEQQVFDEISKPGKLAILDAPLFTCEHKSDKVPESTLIVPNHADVVRKVEVHICPLGVLDLTEVIEKIVAPLENFRSIEVSLNTEMIEREETKLKIGDDKDEADDGLLNETHKWMGSVLGKPVLVVVFSRGKGVIMFDELKVFDYLTDKKFDPGGDAILEVADKFGNELCSKNCSCIVFSHDSDQELYERQLLVGLLSLSYSYDYNNDGKFSNEGFYKMSNYYGCDGSVQGIFHPFPFYRSSYQGYDGCGQLKAGEKEEKLEFSDYRVKGVNPFLFSSINVFDGSSKEEFFIEELVKIFGEQEVENELKKFSSLHTSRHQIRPYARIGDPNLSILGGEITKTEVRLIWAAGTCDKTNPHFWITPDWPWQQEVMSNTMRRIWKRKRIMILCIQSVAIQPSSPNRSDDSLQPYINSKRVNCKIQGVDKWTSTICDSLQVVELVDLCVYILQHIIAWKQTIKLPILGKGQMSNRCDYLVTNEDHRLCIETKLIEEVAGMRFHLHFLGIFLGVRLQLFTPKFDGYAGENNFQFPELVGFFYEYYSYFIHNKNEQVHQLYLCGGIAVILFARKGNEPLVVASGVFSGIFSDSSWNTYFVAAQTCLQNVYVLCDVQLTEDGSRIIVDKLKREYKVEANAGTSQVNYQASISKVIEVKFVQKKQSSPPNFRLSLFLEHKNCGLNGLWRGKILPDFGEAPSQVNDQYFTNLLLEINARLDVVSSILAMIVVGVGTVSSSVTTGNKETSVLMFDQPLSKPPSQFQHLSRGDTTLSRGEY